MLTLTPPPEIDHNFSKAHRIVTTSILPIVEQYGENSKNVWEASKFWKQFFEASANVSLSGYEELANDDDDETTNAEESSIQDGSTVGYTPRAGRDGDDATMTSAMDQSGLQGDDSLLDDGELTGSTPRAPATRSRIANFSNLESPYEALKRELKGEPPAPDADDDEEDEEEDSTVIFAQHTARLPDMSMTPHLPRGQPSPERKSKDPLLHRILDKNYRLQATPHKGPMLRVSPLKGAEGREKGKGKGDEEAAPAPAWQDSPMSSPIMEMPKLRSEAFMSPVKTAARQRLVQATTGGGPRTPGVSVQTPNAGRKKTRDIYAEESTAELPEAGQKYEIDWDSDSDEGAFGGMSPPKTIQFALPPSKLLQTPGESSSMPRSCCHGGKGLMFSSTGGEQAHRG